MDALGLDVEFIQEIVERVLPVDLDVINSLGQEGAQYSKQCTIVVLGTASGDHVGKLVVDWE